MSRGLGDVYKRQVPMPGIHFFFLLFNICSLLPKYHKEIIQTVPVLENVTPVNSPHAHINVFAHTQMNIPHGHVFPYTNMQT